MPSLFFLLFLLSLSIYSCDCRHLGELADDSRRSSHHSGKDVAKAVVDDMSVPVKPTQSSDDRNKPSVQGPVNGNEISSGATNGRAKALEAPSRDVEEMRETVSGAARTQTLAKVPWSVPRPGAHREHPGFNVDYAGPRTHPPSHN